MFRASRIAAMLVRLDTRTCTPDAAQPLPPASLDGDVSTGAVGGGAAVLYRLFGDNHSFVWLWSSMDIWHRTGHC